MAAPNIVNVANIYANNSLVALSSNVSSTLVSNPASSSTTYKINTILIANKDTSNNITVTVSTYNQAGLGGTGYVLGSITVPNLSTLTLLDKGTSVYLLENQSIGANTTSGAASNMSIITSWEQIS